MVLGAINHVAIAVSNLPSSINFYTPILEFLGYKNTENYPEVAIWESGQAGCAINLWQAKPELLSHLHKMYAPGLHHLAFNADSSAQVNEFYQLLLNNNVNVLEPPSEYNYAPGYYAVFFIDLDGIKLELAHIPGLKVK